MPSLTFIQGNVKIINQSKRYCLRLNIENKINMDMPQDRGAKNSHTACSDATLLIPGYIFVILLPGNDSAEMNEVGMCFKL